MQLLDASTVAANVCNVFEHQERLGHVLVRHAKIVVVLYAKQYYGLIQFALIIVQVAKFKRRLLVKIQRNENDHAYITNFSSNNGKSVF
jgi:hypothetical protein